MISVTPQDVSDTSVTVTGVSTPLYDLINTASIKKTAQQYYDGKYTDTIMIEPEDGDVRFLFNADPEFDKGERLQKGVKYYLPNIELFGMRLVSTDGNVKATVTYYRAERGESPVAVASGVTVQTPTEGLHVRDPNTEFLQIIKDQNKLLLMYSSLITDVNLQKGDAD